MSRAHRTGSGGRTDARDPLRMLAILPALLVALAFSGPASAQQGMSTEVVTIAKGQSALLQQPGPVERVSIADPEIADALVISPFEVLVNGIGLGTTTLILWGEDGSRRLYSVEVTADAGALRRTLQTLYRDESIEVEASGDLLILSGDVSEGRIAQRALDLARGTGARVLDNLQVPPAQQILLQVRFAEVSQSAVLQLGTEIRTQNPQWLGLERERDDQIGGETLSDGLVSFFLLNPNASINVVMRALRGNSTFRSLAEPNLLAMDGSPASFLAGGEFPFPVVQAGASSGAVTIQWREFGVRLNFTPHITGAGNIRLEVAPEVSSLDFAAGLTLSGFAIPSILSRKAETEIELMDGQTFAIAGLLDNSWSEGVDRIPILGSIPILGTFFRSKDRRENRTELLVLVTPRLVQPLPESPPVPTGEPDEWKWDGRLRNFPPPPDH
jgi:pilus assembly protein CpaC